MPAPAGVSARAYRRISVPPAATRVSIFAPPDVTFPMSEADVDAWREQFQVPDAAELDAGEIPGPPTGWPGWTEWAAGHWPSCTDS
jgi:hypothetical protein